MTNFSDVFKSSFLANVGAVTFFDMFTALLLSLGMGYYIFWIYKKSYRGVMYDSGFGKALTAMTVITTILILAVTSNVVLSLGMVGALSIVRFRTAIKDPMEIVFLFWSIEVGIVLAAGMIPLAVFANIILGLILLLLSLEQNHHNPFLVVIQCETEDAVKEVMAFLGVDEKRRMLKSITRRSYETEGSSVKEHPIELVIEWHEDDGNGMDIPSLFSRLQSINEVTSVAAISYDGKFVG